MKLNKNIVYGLDAAPTHGALVGLSYQNGQPQELIPVAHFTRKDDGMGKYFMETKNAPLLSTDGLLLAHWVAGKIPDKYRVVYVDYDIIGTAFLPSGRVYGSKWSFLMGSFFTHLNSRGLVAVPLSSGHIRSHFNLSARASKEVLYLAYKTFFPMYYSKLEGLKLDKALKTDYLDAAILALVGGS